MRVALIAALAALLPCYLFAQAGTGTITGNPMRKPDGMGRSMPCPKLRWEPRVATGLARTWGSLHPVGVASLSLTNRIRDCVRHQPLNHSGRGDDDFCRVRLSGSRSHAIGCAGRRSGFVCPVLGRWPWGVSRAGRRVCRHLGRHASGVCTKAKARHGRKTRRPQRFPGAGESRSRRREQPALRRHRQCGFSCGTSSRAQ